MMNFLALWATTSQMHIIQCFIAEYLTSGRIASEIWPLFYVFYKILVQVIL